ncbi:MAG: DUF1501 domain-containing protein [Planctomycetota bacterium]|nr:DUF1501 domain-containing protein [Planctomycetota bacterium]
MKTRPNRRSWLKTMGLSIGGISMSGWLPALAEQVAADPARRRQCILLWMNGGPSQTDTFDMKPDHKNGGDFKEIATNVPGIRISEHLPKLATLADKLAIIRGLSTKEGDHGRATHLLHTGQRPMGPIRYPAFGASLAKALGSETDALPSYVSIAPFRGFDQQAFEAGFLGPKYSPLVVGNASTPNASAAPPGGGFAELKIESLQPISGISPAQNENRRLLWEKLQSSFVSQHASGAARAHESTYQRTMRLLNSGASGAFDLAQEPEKLRETYGKGLFGQGCLMARRLIEQGVPFVEVALNGWDTHNNNFTQVKDLSLELDAGWSSLLTDLHERGLLATTTIMWMGEFGRTPRINGGAGRDHFPQAWSCVLAGGGIAGGQVYGKTSDSGVEVVDGKVGVERILATACAAVGVDPKSTNISDTGRPIAIVDGDPIEEILT